MPSCCSILAGRKTRKTSSRFYNLFRDKYIIDLPFGIRQGVASMIASRRAPEARKNYAHMGGGSPILRETEAQAHALEAYINSHTKGLETRVFIGMRYWHPFIEQAAADIDFMVRALVTASITVRGRPSTSTSMWAASACLIALLIASQATR